MHKYVILATKLSNGDTYIMTLRGDVLRNIVALVLALAIAVPFSMASMTAFADTTESNSEEISTDETTDDVEDDDTDTEESTESSASSETSTASAASTVSVPSASSEYYVYDENNVISDETRQSIVQTGEYLNSQYGAQIVVAVLNSLGDANIETYTNQLLTSWKVGGDAGYGLVFLMDISNDDYYCISGDGLKQLYTSSKIQTVLDDNIESLFAAKNYDAAALAFVNACSSDLEKYMQDLVASGVVLTTNNVAGNTTTVTDSSTNETTETTTNTKSSSGFIGFLKGLLIFVLVLIILLCAGFVVIYLHGQKVKRERAARRKARNRSAQGSGQRTSQRAPQSRERSRSSSRPSNSQSRTSSQPRQQAKTRETTVVNKSGSTGDSYRDFMNKY